MTIKTIYIADDGTEFSSKENCERYETNNKTYKVEIQYSGSYVTCVTAKSPEEARANAIWEPSVEDIDFNVSKVYIWEETNDSHDHWKPVTAKGKY